MPVIQPSLFGEGEVRVRAEAPAHRTWLDDACWVEQVHGWLGGQADLYDELAAAPIWHRGQRVMWGELRDEPRLTATLPLGSPGVPDVIADMARALERRYRSPMHGLWLNWYRSGGDAVAWHADRIGRVWKDPPVAVVSLGSARRFLVRPKGGGPARVFTPAGGDLLVMGGACQHRWEHSVPRSRRGGPRISVTFRPWVRGVPEPTRVRQAVGIQAGRDAS